MNDMVILRSAKNDHLCDLPVVRRGMVIRCSWCGTIWKAYVPGNPDYNAWRRVPTWWARVRRWWP